MDKNVLKNVHERGMIQIFESRDSAADDDGAKKYANLLFLRKNGTL